MLSHGTASGQESEPESVRIVVLRLLQVPFFGYVALLFSKSRGVMKNRIVNAFASFPD